MLSPDELTRYQRQMIIPGLGQAGQEKLKKARALVAGAGGLGCPAAVYLAAAGVGTIRIVDPDTVELGNLNRQILHWTRDIGKYKIDSASEKLQSLNPEIKIETLNEKISEGNVNDLCSSYDLILDAVDNLPTRYILNRAAIENKIPIFHGAISGFEGRAMTVIPGQSACLMCLYRGVVVSAKTPVIGVTPGIIACIQATEAIKYITGVGQLLANRFLVYDGLNMRFNEIKVSRDPHCQQCGDGWSQGLTGVSENK
jgi:molybdopterin/thiamine biosynthesis adenylyltransferase